MIFKNLSPNMRGVIWALLSAICFVLMTVLVRILGQDIKVSTMIFWRALAGLAVILPMSIGKTQEVWQIKRPFSFFIRVSTSTAAFFASFYAFANLPIAEAQALSFSRTLFITILAVFILHEKVAWRRWSAVAIGFVGIIIMSKPDGNLINFASFMAILAAFLYAISIILIKELTKDHAPTTLVMYANIFTILVGIPFLFFNYEMPNLTQMITLMIMGFCGVGAQICYIRALSIGDASLMAIVDYVRLPLSALGGFIIFSEIPDISTIIGATLVISSTLYITAREAKLGKSKPPQEPN